MEKNKRITHTIFLKRALSLRHVNDSWCYMQTLHFAANSSITQISIVRLDPYKGGSHLETGPSAAVSGLVCFAKI